jgi:hypothetical protein
MPTQRIPTLKVYPPNNLTLLLGFIIVFGIWAVLLGQDTNFDLRSYHYYNGYAFLHHRVGQDIMPSVMQTYLNPLFDALTYLLINLHSPNLTTFLLGAVNGICAFLIFKIAQQIFSADNVLQKPIYSFIAVFLGVTGGDAIALLGSLTSDTYSTVFVLLSIYCFIRSLNEKPARFYLAMSGLLLGAVTGLKLTNFCFFIGMNITVLFFEAAFSDLLIYWSCCFIGLFLVSAFWMYPLYVNLGNPIFPFYNNFFHSDYVPRFTFNIEPGSHHVPWYVLVLLPYLLTEPNLYTTEVFSADSHFFVLTIVLLFAWVCRAKYTNNKPLRFLTFFFIVSYVTWCIEFHVYRYALPLEMLSPILMIGLIKPLVSSKKIFITILIMLGVSLVLPASPADWGRKHLSADYIALQAPPVPDDAVIVMLSRPYSYAIPFFNPKTHFVGVTFAGLQAAPDEKDDGLMYKQTIKVLRDAAEKNKLYGLGFIKSDTVTSLSYALLLSRKIGPTEDCSLFKTNLGDQLVLCKLMLFKPMQKSDDKLTLYKMKVINTLSLVHH